MMIGIGIISFIYGPLLVYLKDPPPRTEQEKQETTVSLLFDYSIAIDRDRRARLFKKLKENREENCAKKFEKIMIKN